MKIAHDDNTVFELVQPIHPVAEDVLAYAVHIDVLGTQLLG
jgi:hypothetical protein